MHTNVGDAFLIQKKAKWQDMQVYCLLGIASDIENNFLEFSSRLKGCAVTFKDAFLEVGESVMPKRDNKTESKAIKYGIMEMSLSLSLSLFFSL